MKEIDSLVELQNIEFDILCYIDKVCKKNQLRYFLAGGTLLGAVRHKNFIPWDDDMDISMPRPDYDKLVDIFDAEANKDNSPYKIIKLCNEYSYCMPFIKIVDTRTVMYARTKTEFQGEAFGVFVDVFPIDGVSDKNNVRTILKIRDNSFALARSYSTYKNLTVRGFFKVVIRKVKYGLTNREVQFEKMQNELRKNSFDTSPFVMSTFGMRGKKEVIEQRCFSDAINAEFRGAKFPIPVGYKQYLTQMYGDYMTPPPENNRESTHDYIGYWKDD